MDERIREIRNRLVNGIYGRGSSADDVRWLLRLVSQFKRGLRQKSVSAPDHPVVRDIKWRLHLDSHSYSEPGRSAIINLLNIIEQGTSAIPESEPVEADMLAAMRSVLDAGKYPNPNDVYALIDTVECTRAQHVKDLDEIVNVIREEFGADPHDNVARAGRRVALFVQRKLDRVRGGPDDNDRIDRIAAIWDATGVVSVRDMEFLVEHARKFQGDRDPDERRADFGRLRKKLYAAAGLSEDVPMSFFSLVDAIEKRIREQATDE